MKQVYEANGNELHTFANEIRLDIIDMCHRLGKENAHLGGCLSLVDVLTVLFSDVLKYDVNNRQYDRRDRVIMSKGQGSIALYAAMRRFGLIEDLSNVGNLLGDDTHFYKQSVRNPEIGIEFSSGSLGQGLAFSIGVAQGLKWKGLASRVYCIMGEGELEEGSVWEAASIAAYYNLDNLTVIVDKNNLQIDGTSNIITNPDSTCTRFEAFGFRTTEINGHDYMSIRSAFAQVTSNKPTAIIAKTVKGKGVSFAENNVEWHQNHLTDELYKQAKDEILRTTKGIQI